ncbi:MAG: sigma-70 family RNA polymerase sigma factor [Oscillospiraceae bacterium]|nr:sigma-70 family RNA polymerase sigma factor [Oscillospiraceae bacterium]
MVDQSLQSADMISKIVDKYSNMIYRLAISNVKTKSNADDIYQDVFLRYIKYVRDGGTFDCEEHVKAWFIRVTINCCKSFNTSSWFRRTVALDESVNKSYEENNDTKIDFYNALMKLPQKYRSVIHLFYYEQLSVEQIGNILNVKNSTVRTQLTRARVMLKDILKGEYLDG